MIPKEKIDKRIIYLRRILRLQLSRVDVYRLLSEAEKIPLRIKAAELMTLENYKSDTDLDLKIASLVFDEQYCGAEGVKRAKEWIDRNI